MAQQLTPTHRHLTVLARQLASGLACLVFQCKWSLCLGLPIVELHAQFNISHKENHNKTTYNQWYISCFLVRERLFLSSNLTWESQGCLRVTLQQILVPRGGDHFVQRHECSWCKESWPSARNKKSDHSRPQNLSFCLETRMRIAQHRGTLYAWAACAQAINTSAHSHSRPQKPPSFWSLCLETRGRLQ